MTITSYVALGDSLTQGVGDPVPELEHTGWSQRLMLCLAAHQPTLRYANLARRGLKLTDIRTTQLDWARALQPDLISLLIGGNDALNPGWDASHFAEDYDATLRDLVATGSTVLTATLFNPAPLLPASLAAQVEPRMTAMNAAVRALSAQHGVICVDGSQSPNAANPHVWSADRKHPNALGHLLIARGVVTALSTYTQVSLESPAVRLAEEISQRYGLVAENPVTPS